MSKKYIRLKKTVGTLTQVVYPGPREYEVLEETKAHYIIRPFSGSDDRLKVPKDAATETAKGNI